MEEIAVSICCLAYNHEKYLRRCLDGFLMQKTNFKFEVLIHDDASTDKTADIIREYEKKYPDIIKPIYQSENQFSQGIKLSWAYQYPRAKGKYIAWCEGDDFWTDACKLQKQFDALESNPDCSFCTHRVEVVDVDEVSRNEFFPKNTSDSVYQSSIIPKDSFLEYLLTRDEYPFQTSSYFARSEYIKEAIDNPPDFVSKFQYGDMPLMLLFAAKGNVYYINDAMSNYTVNRPGSWSECYSAVEFKIKGLRSSAQAIMYYNPFTDFKYKDYVEHYANDHYFTINRIEKNYKGLLEPKFKPFFNNLSLKTKLHIRIYAYFPFLIPVINKIFKKD